MNFVYKWEIWNAYYRCLQNTFRVSEMYDKKYVQRLKIGAYQSFRGLHSSQKSVGFDSEL